MSGKWRIGTSGWNYKHWKEIFYPPQTSVSKWLDFYGEHFDTVEVNATFYRLPKPETFDRWRQDTPENFLWAVKGSKFITHTRRLKDCAEPLERLYSRAERLKEKLGAYPLSAPAEPLFPQRAYCHILQESRPLSPACPRNTSSFMG